MRAASNGHADAVNALLTAGADVHAADPVGAARPTGAPARVTPQWRRPHRRWLRRTARALRDSVLLAPQ